MRTVKIKFDESSKAITAHVEITMESGDLNTDLKTLQDAVMLMNKALEVSRTKTMQMR